MALIKLFLIFKWNYFDYQHKENNMYNMSSLAYTVFRVMILFILISQNDSVVC